MLQSIVISFLISLGFLFNLCKSAEVGRLCLGDVCIDQADLQMLKNLKETISPNSIKLGNWQITLDGDDLKIGHSNGAHYKLRKDVSFDFGAPAFNQKLTANAGIQMAKWAILPETVYLVVRDGSNPGVDNRYAFIPGKSVDLWKP